jgi:hypothetical protein
MALYVSSMYTNFHRNYKKKLHNLLKTQWHYLINSLVCEQTETNCQIKILDTLFCTYIVAIYFCKLYKLPILHIFIQALSFISSHIGHKHFYKSRVAMLDVTVHINIWNN